MSLRQFVGWSTDQRALIRAASLLREAGGTPEDVSTKSGALGVTAIVEVTGAGAGQKLLRDLEAILGRGGARMSIPGGDQRDSAESREAISKADTAASKCGCRRTTEPVLLHDALGRATGARLRYEAQPVTLEAKLGEAGLQLSSCRAWIEVDVWVALSEDDETQSTNHPQEDKVSQK